MMINSKKQATVFCLLLLTLGSVTRMTTDSSPSLLHSFHHRAITKSPLAPPDKGTPDDTIGGTTRIG